MFESFQLHLMSLIVLISQFLIFYGYVFYVYKKFGILSSISDSYYSLPDTQKLLFPMFTWALGITLFLIGYETHLYWYFISAALISLVGVASQFKLDTFVNDIHLISAATSIICTMVGLMIQHVYFPMPIAVLLILYLYLKNIPNHIWWIEVVSYTLIIAGFISKML